MISSGFPILGGPGSRRFCRPIYAAGSARKQLMIVCPVPSGIVHALRCGGHRADCADIHGPKKTLCNRFVLRAERGIREGVFNTPAGAEDTPDRLFIDSSCIRVHRCASGGKGRPWPMDRPYQRRTQHRAPRRLRPQGPPHVFVNCVLLPTPGNVHDCKVAQRCIEAMPPSAEPVAGKGRDGRELREWLEERGTGPVIPPRKTRKIRYHDDRAVYRERNIIERMFCRLKDRRRSPHLVAIMSPDPNNVARVYLHQSNHVVIRRNVSR